MGSGFSACQSSSTVHVRSSLKSLREPENRRPNGGFHTGSDTQTHRSGGSYRNGIKDNALNRSCDDNCRQAKKVDQGANDRRVGVLSIGDAQEDNDAVLLNHSSQSLNLTSSNGWTKGSLESSTGLSDSCDSGIYEGHRKRSQQRMSDALRGRTTCDQNDQKSKLALSHDTLDNNSHLNVNDVNESEDDRDRDRRVTHHPHQDTRINRPISKPGNIRSNRQSAPNLMQLAIDEAEEDDEAVRLSRPARPKTAYIRKRSGLSIPSAKKSKTTTTTAASSKGSDDTDDLSEFTDDDEFDSDVLSIPDETRVEITPRGPEISTIKLGPQFNKVTHAGSQERVDWWSVVPPLDEDDCLSPEFYDARSQASGGRRFKNSSEFGKKNLQAIDRHLNAEIIDLSQRPQSKLEDYQTMISKARPRFLKVISDCKALSCQNTSCLDEDAIDTVTLQLLEENMARNLYSNRHHLHPGNVSAIVLSHISTLDRLCDVIRAKPIRIEVLGRTRSESEKAQEKNKKTETETETGRCKSVLLWQEFGIEDEGNASDLSDEENHFKNKQTVPVLRHQTLTSKVEDQDKNTDLTVAGLPPKGNHSVDQTDNMTSDPRVKTGLRRMTSEHGSIVSGSDVKTKINKECKSQTKKRPDSGIVVSSSASYSSSEATRDVDSDVTSQTEWIAKSLEMLEDIYRVRTEDHDTIKNLVKAVTTKCNSDQLKAHALYRWLTSQSLPYYTKYTVGLKMSSPTAKMKQLAEGKTNHATIFQEMARAAGLKCEKIEGYAKGKDYMPGSPMGFPSNQHSWNAISFNGHYALVDAKFGSLPYKFFVEHYFMTPPDEFRLSHYPKDKKWLLMTQGVSQEDFETTLKVWPAMIAFNIRPLNMRSLIRTYDGRLSITVLLRSVAVTPQLEYAGPGPSLDPDNLALNIDQEIRSVDNAETFHMTLPQDGTYFFTLLVHDLEEDEDIPVFQTRIEYMDELL